MQTETVPVETVIGVTMKRVVRDRTGFDDRILFEAESGQQWEMVYVPDCCANCNIDEIVGDLTDLVGVPIAMAEESTNSDRPRADADVQPDSFTWTFYKFATNKGYVTVRWYGASNGYYSETATFRRIIGDEDVQR